MMRAVAVTCGLAMLIAGALLMGLGWVVIVLATRLTPGMLTTIAGVELMGCAMAVYGGLTIWKPTN